MGPLSGFISKRGFPFEAELILKKDETDGLWKMQFDFGEEEKAEVTDEEIESAPVVGVCPCCGARVLEMPAAYQCEKNIRGEKKCTFRISKTILSRDITSEEVTELLANKRTQLLSGFISKKSKRAFKAFLIVKGNGASRLSSSRARRTPRRPNPARRTPRPSPARRPVGRPKRRRRPNKSGPV